MLSLVIERVEMKDITERRKNVLRFAIQKSGRLAEGSQNLLTQCGIHLQARRSQLMTSDDSFGVEFLFVRDDDIPGMIESGVCDIGIFGQNLLDEYNARSAYGYSKLEPVLDLGFSRCRLSIASPKDSSYSSLSDMNGKVIATSYPYTLEKFLLENNIEASVVTLHGSVELASHIGVSDLICDLVSSGATLYENGLKEIVKISESQALLVRRKDSLSSLKKELVERLILRIKGVQNAAKNKYIMMHIEKDRLDKLEDILPGSESPTIIELKGYSDKVAVHVVSHEEVFWDTVEKLKAIGASSILVLPIEKMIS
jgi:ATP phosphoribosyltransferase